MKALRFAFRLTLALVFAIAAVLKIRDPKTFLESIQTYHLLERFPAAILALWLPWLELVLAIALWLPKFSRIASAMLATLVIVFIVALAQAWVRQIDISCGCFGQLDRVQGMAYVKYILRDAGLLVLAVTLWRIDRKAAPERTGAAR